MELDLISRRGVVASYMRGRRVHVWPQCGVCVCVRVCAIEACVLCVKLTARSLPLPPLPPFLFPLFFSQCAADKRPMGVEQRNLLSVAYKVSLCYKAV